MALPSRLLHFLARHGAPGRFALRLTLEVFLPGAPGVTDLASRTIDCLPLSAQTPADVPPAGLPAATEADRVRVEQVLDVLAGELADVLGGLAALEGKPGEARQVLEEALAADPACLAAARAVDRLAREFDRLGEHNRRLLAGQGHAGDLARDVLRLWQRLVGVADLAEDLRAGAGDPVAFRLLLRRFEMGVRAATAGDLGQAQALLGGLARERADLPSAAAALAAVQAARHYWHEAEQALAHALRLRPGDAELAELVERVARGARGEASTVTEMHDTVPPGTEPPVKVFLEVVSGPHAGARFEFERHDTVVAGRAGGARLQLSDDGAVSRHHFLLEFDPPRCYLRDLGSSNGTFVNGHRVTECLLHDGDLIGAGKTRIRFTLLLSGVRRPRGTSAPDEVPEAEQTKTQTGHSAATVPEGAPAGPVADYEVLQPLGQGSLGVVYLARSRVTGQQCALKLVKPEPAASEQVMWRFLKELAPVIGLRHPSLVRVLEAGVAQGQFFFASEYVEVIDARGRLAAGGPDVLCRGLCALACQVLGGLAHAHAAGLVHGDVKPSNVLVSGQGRDLRARLADFGLARGLADAGLSGLTHEAPLPGTLPFLAPEHLLNARSVGPAADVYSAGATLYYLLTGQVHYDFGRRKDPLAALLEDEPIPLERPGLPLPAGLAERVHRALAKDPADRFASAEAMRQALLPYAGDVTA